MYAQDKPQNPSGIQQEKLDSVIIGRFRSNLAVSLANGRS